MKGWVIEWKGEIVSYIAKWEVWRTHEKQQKPVSLKTKIGNLGQSSPYGAAK
jgi:hypothetical protein